MELPKEEQNKLEQIDQEAEESEGQVTGFKSKANLNEKLILSVKKNQYEETQKCLKKKADIHHEENTKKKWNSLVWACCNGNYKIVKLLISRGAATPYLQVKQQNRHVVLGQTKQMKPNPLHWACFKNHVDVFYLLIKTGLHWQDVDSCGNNSVMLAAAGNAIPIFKAFLQYGVDLDFKNSRGHAVKDLTTNHQILQLDQNYHNAKECCVSNQPFKEKQIKSWCWVCGQFANKQHYKMQWVLSDLKAPQNEKIDGRCSKCWGKAQSMKKDLQQAIQIYEEVRLRKTLEKYSNEHCQIQIRFLDKCREILHKLEVQNQILAYIKSLNKVENYKIILKSVNKIKQMLKDAQPIKIDQNVIEIANKEIQRLNAQRNLRYQIDNIDTSVATRQGVKTLQDVYSQAETKSVSTQYLEVASQIKGKMAKSILAQDIQQMFKQYPQRPDPYPQPLVIDFKSKRPIDPQTKKPTDPVNLLPKKKKGKKQPGFVIPEWAVQLKQMNEKIKQLQDLLSMRQQLGLSEAFVKESQGIIVLMKKQARYRKDMDELQRMVDEANKKKK